MIVRIGLAAMFASAVFAPAFAHPHEGDTQTVVLRGTITDVDLKNGTLALDAIDRDTKKVRNFFVLLDPKIKITRAKKKVTVAELAPGQAITCAVEVEVRENGQKGRMIAFDIQFDSKAKAATRIDIHNTNDAAPTSRAPRGAWSPFWSVITRRDKNK